MSISYKSSDQIQQKTYLLKCQFGCYPQIKFKVKKMSGFSVHHCQYGGILLLVALSYQDKLSRHGPYCQRTRGPIFYTTDSVILSNYHTQLVLYSFRKLIDIDLIIEIRAALCEGLLNICNLHKQPYSNLKSDGFSITFVGSFIMLKVLKNRCLLVQSFLEPHTHPCVISVGASFKLNRLYEMTYLPYMMIKCQGEN